MNNIRIVKWLRRDENALLTFGVSLTLLGVALITISLAPRLSNYVVLPVLGVLAVGFLFMAYVTNPWRKETKNEPTTSS
ncbi:hypothetical protein LCGC14_2186000 [marine sediment metagenome]|uniref:Uncharacterized protein n=1 Tax=marine sediment metagenome TaxID=412755 RepID=A0A0F9GGR9_9ZZZZ